MSTKLPKMYRMKTFPKSIDFFIPGFLRNYMPGLEKTLALKERDCNQWYNEFIDKIIDAYGRKFLPVYRMSDGEFQFILGDQPIDIRLPFLKKIHLYLSNLKSKILLNGGLGAWTEGHYHSGQYSKEEWDQARSQQSAQIKRLSGKGILAIHLSYVEEQPFAERFWPALDQWLIKHKIKINDENYYPFYFIYTMLTGLRRRELFEGRRVLVVNGAKEEKKQKIIKGLKREGVVKVYWCQISLYRSMFDKIDVKPFIGKVDFALVGAGIAKPSIFLQMEDLNVPCIDAGFIFEVWADPENKWKRSGCANDEDYEAISKKKT